VAEKTAIAYPFGLLGLTVAGFVQEDLHASGHLEGGHETEARLRNRLLKITHLFTRAVDGERQACSSRGADARASRLHAGPGNRPGASVAGLAGEVQPRPLWRTAFRAPAREKLE
jgi:hypothetical protein